MTRFVARLMIVVLPLLGWVAAHGTPNAGAAGPATPILLVTNSAAANPFGPYLGEILRAEGLNAFDTAQLASLSSATLSAAALVVLAETALTNEQAALLDGYVAAGGRLIAMRPDPRVYGTLGLTAAGSSTTDGYLRIVTGSSSGDGLQTTTLPLFGPAAHYSAASGSEVLAQLYSNRTSATSFPAVVRRARTASWAFDLARSVVYTRQGKPDNAGVDRDGLAPIRTNDVFYNAIDKDRVPIPHADVQMRLFARVVTDLLADQNPLPRLWYFSDTNRTQMILTGDAHSNDQSYFDALVGSVQSRGGRISIYVPRFGSSPSQSSANTWRSNGHEVGMHPYGAADGLSLAAGYQRNREDFVPRLGNPSRTVRNHQVEWEGWVDAAKVAAADGIELDTSFYTWGPSVRYPDDSQAHGYINGSGQPMKFVDETGALVEVYQQVTSLVDEQLVWGDESEGLSPSAAIAVSRKLIDDSQAGYYAAIMTQFHVDYFVFGEVRPWAEGTMDYADGLDIPMWTAERWLGFAKSRHDAAFSSIVWDGTSGQLSFSMSAPANADTLSILLPLSFDGVAFHSALVDGAPSTHAVLTVNGRQHALIKVSAANHSFHAGYGVPPQTPTPTEVAGPPTATPTATPTIAPTATPTIMPTPTATGIRTPRSWLPLVAASP